MRADTFARDGGRCRCCFRVLHLNDDNPWMHANIHETEGPRHESAIDVTLAVTITLCKNCHEHVEHHKLRLDYGDDERKCNATVYFSGRTPTNERIERRESPPAISFEAFRAVRAASNLVRDDDRH